VPVPEREGAGVRAGHAVTLTVEGDPTVYRGRVVRLSPIVQEQNRTLLVEAEVAERARIPAARRLRAGRHPDRGQPAGGHRPRQRDHRLRRRRESGWSSARAGPRRSGHDRRRLGEDVEIIDGLKRGDAVVARPGNLVGGQPVTVTP